MTLMIDRIGDIAATLDVDTAARVVGSRLEVFDVTNVANYLQSDESANPWVLPCGPPFDLYWFEWAIPAKYRDQWSEEMGDQAGFLCASDTDADGVRTVTAHMYSMNRKKVHGPVLTIQLLVPGR